MNQLSPERLREIYDQAGGDLEKVAAALGINASELSVRPIQDPPLVGRGRRPPVDLGQNPNLRRYIISSRHAQHPVWPKADQKKIDDARAKYEAGTHEMCQGRDRNWFVLYCIPRKQRAGARKFFHVNE